MTSPAANWSTPGNEPLRNESEVAIQVQQMGLKVHYTFDKLEQTRCLARLPQLIQVQSLALDDKTTIGIIDLNLCLSAVSQGSPELINACTNPQSAVDYAVYVYDYSEPDTPLVGHGMLSGLLQNETQDATSSSSTGNSSMVTGLVTRNLLAMFGKGISHTLEVKMKFSESQRVALKPVIVAPQPIRQPVAVPTISEIQSSIEPLMTPAGSAEWSMLVQSNPQLAAQMAHLTPVQQSRALTMDAASRGQSPALAPSRIASPAVAPRISRQDSYTDSAPQQQQQQQQQQPQMHQLQQTFQIQQPQQRQQQQQQQQQFHQQQSSRQGTPVEAPPAVPTKEKAVLETVPLGDQAPSRPSSRASRKRGTTGRPRGRPRKNATPSEANGNTSGYEDGTDDDPPPKRRATTTAVPKSLNTPFASVHESLRVAASTSGSLRSFRPLSLSEPSNAPSHIQDVPRAPTPVPFAEKVKPRVTGSLRRTSTLNQEHSNQTAGAQSEDARSPNDQPLAAQTPFSEASTPDFGSSPPMPRTAQFLHRSSPAPSSPILPPMPMSTNDSGFMSGGLDDSHEYSRQARAVRQKTTKIHGRDPRIPVHVFHVGNGAPVVYKNSVDVTSKSKAANVPPPPPQQATESPAPTQQLIPTGPPLAHPALYAPPQPKMPLPRLDRSQQSSTACSPENNPQPSFVPAFQQHSPEVNDSAPVTPAQTNEGEKLAGAETATAPQPQTDKTGQRASSMHPPQSQKMPNQTHHVQQLEKQHQGQNTQTAPRNSHLSAGLVNFDSRPASQSQDAHSQELESQDMIIADLGFASTENRVFSGADGSTFNVGDLMALGQAIDEARAQNQQTGGAEGMTLEDQESMIRALGMAMDKAEAEGSIQTAGQSASHRLESATPPQLEAELSRPETAKTSHGSYGSRRKTPNSVATTPHPTSFSEAPCPPSDSAIMLPYPTAATSPPAGGRSNKNYVKKLAIKEKLEQAVMNGEMPPFCSNCGAIETPTWRKIYVQECTGIPAYHEYSDKPGRVTAIEITTRDEAQNPTGYRMIKKSLAGDDDKSKWNDALLCNPCGIWLCKNNKHRPMDRWDKDAERLGQERRKRGTGRAPVRKRKNTSAASTANANANASVASQSVLTSEANFMTDPLCVVDYVSSISEGQLALPAAAHAPSTVTRAHGRFDSNNADVETGNSRDDGAAAAGAGTNNQSQHDTADNTPENCEYGDLGNTRRLLFPYSGNARSGATRKPLDERSLNPTRPPNRRHHEYSKSSLEDNTVLAMSEADSLALDNEIEALFRSPMRGFDRPSTPPGHSSARELEFKTPSRPTPSHRPITRSVSRSIRSVRSSKNLLAQNGMPETPSRTTPRPSSSAVAELRGPESPSLRRSPRINKGMRSTGKKVLTIGGRQVEAAMSDIDAALAEFSRSITDHELAPARHSSQQHYQNQHTQTHRQTRSSMQSPEKSDLDTYLKSSMVDQWSPSKDWTDAFGIDMLNQEDLKMLAESFQADVDEEGESMAK